MKGWIRFFRQWQRDFKLWVFFMSFFLVFRIIFILIFRDQIHPLSTFAPFLKALLNGMRFDSVICTLCVMIPFIFSIASGLKDIERIAERVRFIIGVIFLSLSSFLCVVTLEYFREYGDQFNYFLFGLIYDDLQATLMTIIKAYNIGRNAIIFIIVMILGTFLMRRFIRNPVFSSNVNERISSYRPTRIGVTLLIVFMMIIGARGSLGTVPVQDRHAAITTDYFLNKTILNPYTSLRYAIQRHLRNLKTEGIKAYIPDKNLVKACQVAFHTDEVYDDLDRYMLRSAQGPKGIPPRHIFYIVAESYSAWPMWDKYASLGLSEGVKGLAHDGISIHPFIPSNTGSMSSLNAIMTGLLDGDIHTNYRQSSQHPYPTSIAKIFKEMGYRVRFFYGGYLSWQRVGDFCKDQGFDEVYGGEYMGSWAESNDWGIDDERLFAYINKKVNDDIPSFNIIFTTSNHPPFTVDLQSKGFPISRIQASLYKMLNDKETDKKVLLFLGHFGYSDRCIANFSRMVTAKLPRCLVVLTGDHPGRIFIQKAQDPIEGALVPCVFFGPDVLKGVHSPHNMTGSHLDITPTLIELAAPKGFAYHSMGQDMLSPESKPVGVGRNVVITDRFLLNLLTETRLFPLPGFNPLVSRKTIADLKQHHDMMHGIAWWRIMKGPHIEPVTSRTALPRGIQ
jgi:phosphoglycerol transferase MdoB-like AlkP superfamily enzyme